MIGAPPFDVPAAGAGDPALAGVVGEVVGLMAGGASLFAALLAAPGRAAIDDHPDPLAALAAEPGLRAALARQPAGTAR